MFAHLFHLFFEIFIAFPYHSNRTNSIALFRVGSRFFGSFKLHQKFLFKSGFVPVFPTHQQNLHFNYKFKLDLFTRSDAFLSQICFSNKTFAAHLLPVTRDKK